MLAGCSDELDRHDSFFLGGEPRRCKEIPAQRPGERLLRTYSVPGTDESPPGIVLTAL